MDTSELLHLYMELNHAVAELDEDLVGVQQGSPGALERMLPVSKRIADIVEKLNEG